MYRRDAALTRPAVGQTAGSCSPNMAACRTCMCPNSVGARVTLTWQTITQYERCWGPLLDQQIIGCVARWPLGNRILAGCAPEKPGDLGRVFRVPVSQRAHR